MSRIQITEERLRAMAEHIRQNYGRESTDIANVLAKGQKFKDHGLTPFYIYSEENTKVYVTSLEAMEGKLNG